MAVFLITVLGYAILCVAPALQCTQIPYDAVKIVLAGGTMEMAFEIAAVIKIYREKKQEDE